MCHTKNTFDSGTRIKVFLLCLNIVFAMAGLGIIAPILPSLQAWANISAVELGFLVSIYSIARIVTNIPAGYLCDLYKCSTITVIGMLILMVGSIISGFAATYFSLLIGRTVTGIGSSMAVVSIQTELLSLSEPTNRSTLMSYFMISRRAGSSLFPFIGGALALVYNWRAVFIFCSILHLIGLTIALKSFKKKVEDIGFTHRVVKESQSRTKTLLPGADNDFKIQPLLLATLYFTTFSCFFNRSGLEKTILPLHGGSIIGLNSFQIGTVLSLSSFVSLGAIYLGGYLSDHYGRKQVLQAGLIVLILTNFLFLFVYQFWGFIVGNILFGLAAFTTAIPIIITTDLVHPSRLGMALGGLRLFDDIGMVVGPIAMGWIMDLFNYSKTIGISLIIIFVCLVMVTFLLSESGLQIDRKNQRCYSESNMKNP